MCTAPPRRVGTARGSLPHIIEGSDSAAELS